MLFRVLIAAVLVFSTQVEAFGQDEPECGDVNGPNQNIQNSGWGQYITTRANCMWDLGFRGEGTNILVFESGIGTRNMDPPASEFNPAIGELHPYYVGRIQFETGCVAPDQNCSDLLDPHAGTTTRIAAANHDFSESNLQGIAIGANLTSISHNNAFSLNALSTLLDVVDNQVGYDGINLDIDVINLSYRSDVEGYATREECAAARAEDAVVVRELRLRGIAVIASAQKGNSDINKMTSPACLPGVISVGATNIDPETDANLAFENDLSVTISQQTSTASFLDLLSPSPGGFTSFSAPHVSGAFAILMQARPNCSVQEILNGLKQSPRQFTLPGTTTKVARIDIRDAYDKLVNCTGADPYTDFPVFAEEPVITVVNQDNSVDTIIVDQP